MPSIGVMKIICNQYPFHKFKWIYVVGKLYKSTWKSINFASTDAAEVLFTFDPALIRITAIHPDTNKYTKNKTGFNQLAVGKSDSVTGEQQRKTALAVYMSKNYLKIRLTYIGWLFL